MSDQSATDTEHWTGDVHQGDATEVLAEMPESSVHCVVTSPPYFGLRDYDVEGQIGLEDSLEEFVGSIVEVAEEIRRVLRPDGDFWLNLGDSFDDRKCKMLAPHRVAIALIDAGWIVRQDNVWSKTDPVPNPVKDRHATTKEYVFHLTPAPDYWFNLDPIRTAPKQESIERSARGFNGSKLTDTDRYPDRETEAELHNFDRGVHPNGKNPGDVWEFSTCNFPEAHFAVFPQELPEAPIKASCPPRVCADCGAPYEREVEEIPAWERDRSTIEREQLQRALDLFDDSSLTEEHLEAVRATGFSDAGHGQQQSGAGRNLDRVEQLAEEAKDVLGGYFREFTMTAVETKGWRSGCDCETDETAAGIVLDPFAGAGTTLLVGKQLGRRVAGVDLNPEYVEMARHRIGLDVDRPEEFIEDDDQATLVHATDGGTADQSAPETEYGGGPE